MRTAECYQALGLEVARDQGSCVLFRAASGGYLGFCRHSQVPEPPGLILTLVPGEVDGAYRKLTELGVYTEAPPKQSERFGIYHFFARDPDGYRLEFQRFTDPLS